MERVDGLTSLGVKRLRECFVGSADVVIRRKKEKQTIKNGDNIEVLKVEPELESPVCQSQNGGKRTISIIIYSAGGS